LGREPTIEEIARDLELSEEEIKHTLTMAQAHLSLDAPLVPGEDGQLLDYVSDQFAVGPDDELYTEALGRSIDDALRTLNEREAKVLRLYFGLGDTEPLTLEQIGECFGITRERVRQIKERALARLRHQSRARFLETFLP
jgi:RNA polymerase primary sigma factor